MYLRNILKIKKDADVAIGQQSLHASRDRLKVINQVYITLVACGSISTSHIDLLPYGSKGNIIATTA
jgi:hypothetical protein